MNNITVVGQLGRDCESKFMPNGDPICTFSVADSQGGKDKPTIWWNCTLFGKRAESLAPYLMKGQAVSVSGALTKREWEKDGVKREALDLRVADVALQGGKRESQPEQQARPAARPQAKPAASNFDDLEDCPF